MKGQDALFRSAPTRPPRTPKKGGSGSPWVRAFSFGFFAERCLRARSAPQDTLFDDEMRFPDASRTKPRMCAVLRILDPPRNHGRWKMEADYVVVGAGSAGCAVAYRLAEAGKSVLVIEHGGTDAGPFIQMPAALSYPMNMKRYDWGYKSEPEPHLGGRQLVCPRGKVVGGSSSINGMVYVRGHAMDYDHWAESGADGWAYADVLPYFKRMENWDDNGHGGDAGWRGTEGPLHVTRGPRKNPLFRAFVEAGRQAGYEVTDDYNGQKQEGFGPMEQTVHKGRRWSAANAYLKPALKRPNCDLVRGLVERVVLEEGRAVGVALAGGRVVRARREVILAASSINSPKILMLSGIGPAAHLAELGIGVVADRRGSGLTCRTIWRCTFSTPPSSRSRFTNTGTCFPKHSLVRSGSLRAQAWVHRTSLKVPRSSAAGQASPIRTSNTTFYLLPCAMTGRRRQRGTGFRPMSDRCGRRHVGLSPCGRQTPPMIR